MRMKKSAYEESSTFALFHMIL